MNRQGIFYIVAAPSGAGKTTLVKALAEQVNDIKISISYTTRPKRANELDGIDYHFVSDEEFHRLIEEKQFLEHAVVYNYQYGTSHEWVLRQLAKGVDVLLEIDWQGARQIAQQFTSAISIYIVPPSLSSLRMRLEQREDDIKIIEQRMQVARNELIHCHEFNYLVVNDDFNRALCDLKHIVKAQRLKYANQQCVLQRLLEELLKTR